MDDLDTGTEGWFHALFASLRDEAHEVADDLLPIMNSIRSTNTGRYAHPTLDGLIGRIVLGIFGVQRRNDDE